KKYRNVIVVVSIIVVVLFFGFFILVLLIGDEVYNRNPCKASSGYLADSLRKKYHIWSWSDSPKNFCFKCSDFDSTKVECNIIDCSLRFDDTTLTSIGDSLINNFAQLFWKFPENENVDSLYLTIESKQNIKHYSLYTVHCNLSRKDISKESLAKETELPKKKPEVKVINEFEDRSFGGIPARTIVINLEASDDYYD